MKAIIQCANNLKIPDAQILGMVDSARLTEIKKTDPHPFLKAFVIAHEGIARPEIVGEGVRPVAWGRNAVRSVLAAVKNGLKLFWEHAPAKSESQLIDNQARESIGEVVGSGAYEHSNKLYAVMVGYISPQFKDQAESAGAASMEAFWDIIDQAGKYIAKGVDQILSIALGDAGKWKPGFPEAHLVASVQAATLRVPVYCMSEPTVLDPPKPQDKKMTFEDVKNFVKEHKVHIWQLYKPEELADDRVFNDAVAKGLKSAQEENKALKQTIKKYETIPVLEKRAVELQLNPIGLKLLDKRKTQFDPGENPDKAIGDFLAEIKAESEELAAVAAPAPAPTPTTTPATPAKVIPNPSTDTLKPEFDFGGSDSEAASVGFG